MVAVPVNPLMAPDVLAWAIERVEPRFTIVDAALRDRVDHADVVIEENWRDWIASHPPTEPDVTIHGDDIWSLLFTSGTTSMPKAVMSSHTYSYMASMTYTLSLTRGLRFESDLRLCTFLPIVFHCGHHAALFSAFLAGGTAIVGRRPDPVQTVATIRDERATAIWAGSPLILRGIAEAAEAGPDRRPHQPDRRDVLVADDAPRPRPAPEGAGRRGPRAARGVRPDRGDELLTASGPTSGPRRSRPRRARSTTSARRTRCWRRP